MIDYNELFTYNEFTGELLWKPNVRLKYKNGAIAGSSSNTNGYVQVQVNNKMHLAHRIIWEMKNGPIPKGLLIDHVDGNRTNNKLSNLRLCTKSQNTCNGKLRSTNTSGFRGVSWSRSMSMWRSQIRTQNGPMNLGYFETKEEAYAARLKAEKEYHKEFAYSSSQLKGVL